MIYQTPETSLNPRQRVHKIVGRPLSFYLGLSSQSRLARVQDLLSLVELEPGKYIDRFPSELSGGERQNINRESISS